ncbi:hypothetical protein J2X81_003301 [Sinomonas atrocyanea]|nr:hypothetical protein [Sinomonas atrocyanea]
MIRRGLEYAAVGVIWAALATPVILWPFLWAIVPA